MVLQRFFISLSLKYTITGIALTGQFPGESFPI